jgi:hypothetical protein
VGQLAWMVDKFREWTHPRHALPTPSSTATASSPT